MLEQTLTVELDRFLPVQCTRSFSMLVGYDSVTDCLASMHRNLHFDDVSLFQLYQIAATASSVRGIALRNRQSEAVANVHSVKLYHDANQMIIAVQPINTAASPSGESSNTAIPSEHAPFVLTFDRSSGLITGTPALLKSYVGPGRAIALSSWLAAIAPEDRQSVRQVLLAETPTCPIRLRFSMVSLTGIATPMEQMILQVTAGTLHSTIRICAPADLAVVELATLALVHDFRCENNREVMLPGASRLHLLVPMIRQCLKEEALGGSILVSAVPFSPACSVCGVPGSGAATLRLCLEDMKIERADLHSVGFQRRSIRRPNSSNPWRQLIRQLHHEGFHPVLSRDDTGALCLTLGGLPA